MNILIALAVSIPLALFFLIMGLFLRKKNSFKRKKVLTAQNSSSLKNEFLFSLEYIFYFLAVLFLIAGFIVAFTL